MQHGICSLVYVFVRIKEWMVQNLGWPMSLQWFDDPKTKDKEIKKRRDK